MTGRRTVRLADGRAMSALDMQTEYLTRVRAFADREGMTTGTHGRVLELWERTLRAVETDNLALVDTEIDWVIKWRMLDRYAAKHRLGLDDPRLAQLDLAYHDVNRRRGLFYLLARRGLVTRETSDL